MERRLASVSHGRAEWFAGVVDGRVVTSLGCQRLEFRLRGETIPGFAICAVHTVATERGRGLAPRLIAAVEDQQQANGARLALLYSDIGHAYYERIGYRSGPAHTGRLRTSRMPSGTARTRLVSRKEYATHYDRLTADWPLLVERPDEYRDHLERREPTSERYVVDHADHLVGAFVLAPGDGPGEGRLLEFAHDDGITESARTTSTGVAEAARSHGFEFVAGWVPNVAGVNDVFEVRPRDEELTMLKPLCGDVDLDEELLRVADRFHESDHV